MKALIELITQNAPNGIETNGIETNYYNGEITPFQKTPFQINHNYDYTSARGGIQRPLLSTDMNAVVEVNMGQQAVTRATDDKPILATFGLGPCVSLVGYEPSAKVGFLTHYTSLTEIFSSFTDLLIAFYNVGLSDKDPTRFEVRLVGGWDKEDELIRSLKTRIKHATLFNMDLVEEDTGNIGTGRTVALDTRTGNLFSYDPMQHPNRQIIQSAKERELEQLEMLTTQTANLIYIPK